MIEPTKPIKELHHLLIIDKQVTYKRTQYHIIIDQRGSVAWIYVNNRPTLSITSWGKLEELKKSIIIAIDKYNNVNVEAQKIKDWDGNL